MLIIAMQQMRGILNRLVYVDSVDSNDDDAIVFVRRQNSELSSDDANETRCECAAKMTSAIEWRENQSDYLTNLNVPDQLIGDTQMMVTMVMKKVMGEIWMMETAD